MALLSCSSSLATDVRHGISTRELGRGNAGFRIGLPRTNLQLCAALRNESLPKKKNQPVDDLLAELEDEIQPFLELQRESRLRTTRHYELMYLVHEAKVDELQDIIKQYSEFVREKKGRIWRLNDWGMRRLAYKIKKTWRANYILMNFELSPQYVTEMYKMLEKDERILRHMVITRKKPHTKDTVPPEELPASRQELLEAELAAEDAAEAAAEKEAQETKAAKRKARREALAQAAREDAAEDVEDDEDDEEFEVGELVDEDDVDDEEDYEDETEDDDEDDETEDDTEDEESVSEEEVSSSNEKRRKDRNRK